MVLISTHRGYTFLLVAFGIKQVSKPYLHRLVGGVYMTKEERMKNAIILFEFDGNEYTIDTLPDKYRIEIWVAAYPKLKQELSNAG
jgi:hypothetical protein